MHTRKGDTTTANHPIINQNKNSSLQKLVQMLTRLPSGLPQSVPFPSPCIASSGPRSGPWQRKSSSRQSCHIAPIPSLRPRPIQTVENHGKEETTSFQVKNKPLDSRTCEGLARCLGATWGLASSCFSLPHRGTPQPWVPVRLITDRLINHGCFSEAKIV